MSNHQEWLLKQLKPLISWQITLFLVGSPQVSQTFWAFTKSHSPEKLGKASSSLIRYNINQKSEQNDENKMQPTSPNAVT